MHMSHTYTRIRTHTHTHMDTRAQTYKRSRTITYIRGIILRNLGLACGIYCWNTMERKLDESFSTFSLFLLFASASCCSHTLPHTPYTLLCASFCADLVSVCLFVFLLIFSSVSDVFFFQSYCCSRAIAPFECGGKNEIFILVFWQLTSAHTKCAEQ